MYHFLFFYSKKFLKQSSFWLTFFYSFISCYKTINILENLLLTLFLYNLYKFLLMKINISTRKLLKIIVFTALYFIVKTDTLHNMFAYLDSDPPFGALSCKLSPQRNVTDSVLSLFQLGVYSSEVLHKSYMRTSLFAFSLFWPPSRLLVCLVHFDGEHVLQTSGDGLPQPH